MPAFPATLRAPLDGPWRSTSSPPTSTSTATDRGSRTRCQGPHSTQSEGGAHCRPGAFSGQGVDVDDEAVVERQEDERQDVMVAHGDDADPVADGQVQQRRRGWRPEIAQDPRSDLLRPDDDAGNGVAGAVDRGV